MKVKVSKLFGLGLSLLFFFACSSDITSQGVTVETQQINEVVRDVEAGKFGDIHSLLIYQNEELLLEQYFDSFEEDSVHFQYSVTKSIASLLVGIAFDQGLITSVDQKLLSFFPEYADDLANMSQGKRDLTLKHVLTMSTGFAWDEWTYSYTDARNDANRMIRSNDMMKFVLDLPVDRTPGTKFTYNSGCSMLLSGVLESRTNMKAEAFAEKYLFGPLGISEWHWEQGNDERFNTGWGLHLLPTDMLKIGQLVMQNGLWEGKQIVSKEWIDSSVQNHISNYGYQWWLSNGFFSARGWGGQVIAISPEDNLIVVTTAGNFNGGSAPGVGIMSRLKGR